MKKLMRYLLILIILLAFGGWTTAGLSQSQPEATSDTDLDTILARAAVKGYLSSLERNPAARSTLADFYLADSAVESEAARNLSSRRIDSYEIIGETWLDDNTYRVTAVIRPDNRVLIADVNKATARWKITNLAWSEGVTLASTSSGANAGATTTTPASTATVLSLPLNVRSGPGLNYPPQMVLREGETVKIVGVSGLGAWYQVAQNGQTIGWISASPTYVATSSSSVDAPMVMAPAPPAALSEGKLILQAKSGGDFYLVNADGSNLRHLSTGIDPAFSPDGAKIAFTRWNGGVDPGSIWIYDLATGQEQHVLGETLQAKAPTWSPDGSEIVVNFQHGGRQNIESKCYKMRSDGSFPSLPHRAYDIKVRPGDPPKLCFKLPPDAFWQLRHVDVGTGAYKDLPSETYSYAPTWDPANEWRVVFGGSTGLQQLDLNRNVYFPFTSDLRDRGPVFSPDGSAVAVTYKQHQHWEIYTIDVATGNRSRLTRVSPLADRAYNSVAPAWSPNGQQIAFVTDRTGQWEFWIMNADGSNPQPLLPPELAAQIPVDYQEVDERLISWGK